MLRRWGLRRQQLRRRGRGSPGPGRVGVGVAARALGEEPSGSSASCRRRPLYQNPAPRVAGSALAVILPVTVSLRARGGIAGSAQPALARNRWELRSRESKAQAGVGHGRILSSPTRIFRRSRLGYISRVQQPVRSAHPACHVPRGPGPRPAAATRTGPASIARGRGDWEGTATPQPPRHRRDRRRMHRAGQVRSPRRHGLVTAGAAHLPVKTARARVRLGCFAPT